MGSLASRPKIPKTAPPPVYIPVVSSPLPSVSAPSAAITETAAPAIPADIAAQARELGLLSRSRGNLSTILTSFRGILGQSAAAPQRKTLLGE